MASTLTVWILAASVLLLSLVMAALLTLRRWRERAAEDLWLALGRGGGGEARPFRPEMVAEVPEPGRRFLLRAIRPGAPLASAVRLRMGGSLRLSRSSDALPMRSEELLAPARGFVWRARVGRGPLRIRGFDRYAPGAGAEMRWWLWGLIPLVQQEGPDLARSARGRLLGESFLVPSTLLPGPRVRWEPVSESVARVHLEVGGPAVPVTLEVDPDGRLRRLSLPRWNTDPANGPVGPLPFGCDELGEEKEFGGYRIPTRFRAGWRLGEEEAFPFFFGHVLGAEYE